MCGIAVAINWPNAENTVRQMISGIMHRGDVTDPVISPMPNTAMGTRRLRIVDGERAFQPQISADGRILIAYNGEIYNFREIRQELTNLGMRFQTDSDAEVVASAISAWGTDAMRRFIGMYAFVAIDSMNGEVLAVRDPMGIKPLYVIQDKGGGNLFCSEIKPLLAACETGEVMLLPPGYMLSKRRVELFVGGLDGPVSSTIPGDINVLDKLLREAVHSHLPHNLPIATMFSGGIDSTLVTHYARQIQPETPGYFLGSIDALDYEFAARYAEQTQLDFRTIAFDPTSNVTSSLIEEIVTTTESFEPSTIRGSICSYLVARQMHHDGYRVILCGEGADELFGGYLHLEYAFAEGNEPGRYVRDQCMMQMHFTNLQRVDRCSMKWQIEARVPFLSRSIINYALKLDATVLVHEIGKELRGKMPLRALYDLYPEQLPVAIRDRSKVPFDIGAGFGSSPTKCPWQDLAEDSISDSEFSDAKKEFSEFEIRTKEEVLYIRALSQKMDINRIPSLKRRAKLSYPRISRMDKLQELLV